MWKLSEPQGHSLGSPNLLRLELSLRQVAGTSNWTLAKRTTVFQMELFLRLDPLFGVLISHHRLLVVPFNHNYCGQCKHIVVGHENCSSHLFQVFSEVVQLWVVEGTMSP